MIKYILPRLFATLTRHSRQKMVCGVDFEWSNKSWTHNLFRIYELIFGRRMGIRKESSFGFYHEDGERVDYIDTYTLEATLAQTETLIRKSFSVPKFRIVALPQLITPNGFVFPTLATPYRFAIATDATAIDAGGTSSPPDEWSHTCTGSNRLLVVGAQGAFNPSNISGATYNAVSMTQVGTGQNGDTVSLRWTYFFWLLAPTTGANTISVAATASTFIQGSSASYTGVKQTGQPDASNTGVYGAPTPSLSVTVVENNSWFIASFFGRTTGAVGANTTARSVSANISGIFDSNGGLAAGSRTMSVTFSGGVNSGNAVGASFAPAATPASATRDARFLTLLGVG